MKVGIIGAGTMGSGIAQAFAQAEGYEVYLCDINEEFAANGKKKIAAGLEKRIAKGKMDQAAADAILNKIHTGVKDICTDCDLVVEAALEVMAVKQQTFKELETICKNPDVIFATNTSSLSITEIVRDPGGGIEPLAIERKAHVHAAVARGKERVGAAVAGLGHHAHGQAVRQRFAVDRLPDAGVNYLFHVSSPSPSGSRRCRA